MRTMKESQEHTLSTQQEQPAHGCILRTTLLTMMLSGQRLQQQAEAALEWGLASVAVRHRLAFVRRGASAPWATAALLVLRVAFRTFRPVTLTGPALWEHLVQRVKDGVNCGARGAVSPCKERNLGELFKMCSSSARKHGKEVENEKRILLIAALSD